MNISYKKLKLLYSYPTSKNKKIIHLDENYIVIHIKSYQKLRNNLGSLNIHKLILYFFYIYK